MSTPLVVNGVTYQYPQQGDKNWGPTLNTWSQAVTLGMLQKAGGSFPLTAETDFGASFGLKVLLLKSQEANIATTGILRLGNASAGLVWRNAANNADLALTVNASNQLTFNGTSIGATTSLTNGHILVGNVSNQPADVALSGDATITNAGVLTIANGAITTAKLSTPVAVAAGGTNSTTALVNGRIMCSDAGVIKEASAVTPSMAIVTDTAGFPATGGATATEISRLSGLSSNAQTQLTARLQLAGGTMSGAINMGSNKITALTQGATTGEAVAFPVNTAQISNSAVTTALLASNAVSQVLFSGVGIGSAASAYASQTTVTITTTGGPVVVLAHMSIVFSVTPYSVAMAVWRTGQTSVIAGSDTKAFTSVSTGATWVPMATVAMETPAAGTYTYNLGFFTTAGTLSGSGLGAYGLTVVELKR